MMATNGRVKIEILVGQIWLDKDPRIVGGPRKFQVDRIQGAYAYVRNVKSGKETRINLGSFIPRKYTLDVPARAPAPRQEENHIADSSCGDGGMGSACGGC